MKKDIVPQWPEELRKIATPITGATGVGGMNIKKGALEKYFKKDKDIIKILSAKYGIEKVGINVTDIVKKHLDISKKTLNIFVHNTTFGIDPVVCHAKTLFITYERNGVIYSTKVREGYRFNLSDRETHYQVKSSDPLV